MTQMLLWDESPGEIRTLLTENGKGAELRLVRSVGPWLHPGVRNVRLGNRIDARRALVHYDGGEGEIAPVPILSEGSLLDAELIRAPIPEPGRWKRAVFRTATDRPAQAPIKLPDSVTAIICADPRIAASIRARLGDHCPDIVIEAAAIEDAAFDLWYERAIIGEFVIEGGLLTIERTRAMTMIDIDGVKEARGVNLAAARSIPWLLRFLAIGGQVGIDFLATANKAERAEIDTELAAAAMVLGQHERTAMNGFGFVQLVLPRPGPNIIEQLCGTALKEASIETQALRLLREASRSSGHGKRQLAAPPAIIDLIKSWPEQTNALQSSLGVQIELVPDASATGYGYAHVSQ
jgi:Ribonuclease E/G family